MIGENIAAIRKERGLTQEQLARMVGVSAQAVSKWENGGAPDAELLPAIADRLEVTVDSLFGRRREQTESMELILSRWLNSIPGEQRMVKLYEVLIRSFQYCYAGSDEGDLKTLVNAVYGHAPLKSCYLNDSEGAVWMRSYMDLDCGLQLGIPSEDCPMFFLLPRPEGGYETNLGENEDYRELFKALSMPGSLELLRSLYRRANNYCSAAAAASFAEIEPEQARAAMEALERCHLLKKEQVELEKGPVEVYSVHDNGAFLPFMLFARWLREKGDAWFTGWNDRKSPLLAVPEKEGER